ncbi:MAG: MCE family protein [Cyanobacteria bacterium RI_101]|nr:MCE family protein [Cyanobacteria bacterium RI_101]
MLRPRTLQEGSVGLFALLGLALLGAGVFWLRGAAWGKQTYDLRVDFEDAGGLQLGAPVRFRGVTVGKLAGLIPGSNGIQAILQISSDQLRMPQDSTIAINRYGLIGEAAIDITPPRRLSERALALDPLAQDCQAAKEIMCDGQTFQGQSGAQLIDSLTRLSEAYSNPELMKNINETLRNAALASARVAAMSDEIALLSKSARGQIQGVSRTTAAISQAAENAALLGQNLNQVLERNQASLDQAIRQSALLITQLNQLVAENRGQITAGLGEIRATNRQLQALGKGLEVSVAEVNAKLAAVDAQRLSQQLEEILANTAATSANLQSISANLNDPQLLLTVQRALESARVTLENTQKITSDVEQLTGDPNFRTNLRKLVEGLGNLVSQGESLQNQLYAQQLLEESGAALQRQLTWQAARLQPLPSP